MVAPGMTRTEMCRWSMRLLHKHYRITNAANMLIQARVDFVGNYLRKRKRNEYWDKCLWKNRSSRINLRMSPVQWSVTIFSFCIDVYIWVLHKILHHLQFTLPEVTWTKTCIDDQIMPSSRWSHSVHSQWDNDIIYHNYPCGQSFKF